jgi:predicted nuclease of restriction endonuclease-like (RecB) superfamily/CheY-like chemotaxis protein
MINCIIVDDEPHAIEVLEHYVKQTPHLHLVASFTNPIEALQLLGQQKIDLVFLDIQMPEITGIDFIKAIQGKSKVILTTAYSEFALEGYDLYVVDYLLKPVVPDELFLSMQKALESSEKASEDEVRLIMNNLGANKKKKKAMTDATKEKFLVLYLIPSSVMADWAKTDPTIRQAEEQKLQVAWGKWMSENAKMIIRTEAGGKTKRVTESGVSDTKNDALSELRADLEQRLIDHLQSFLLELGRGFAFVARQMRVSTETKDFYIDLVFYNYLLKCFVLFDLKPRELTHGDIGQMDMYVRMFDEQQRGPGHGPTVGIILCAAKDASIVRYSVLHGNEKLFATRYKLVLPSEEQLRLELIREQRLLEERGARKGRRKK